MGNGDYENFLKSSKPEVKESKYVNVFGNREHENVKAKAQKVEKEIKRTVPMVLPK